MWRRRPTGAERASSSSVRSSSQTAGAADTVKTWSPRTGRGNGFAFDNHDAAGLRWGIEAALATYRDGAAWRRIVQNGMAEDFSWDAQARLYELVYARLGAAA